jgi:hypothetical protein
VRNRARVCCEASVDAAHPVDRNFLDKEFVLDEFVALDGLNCFGDVGFVHVGTLSDQRGARPSDVRKVPGRKRTAMFEKCQAESEWVRSFVRKAPGRKRMCEGVEGVDHLVERALDHEIYHLVVETSAPIGVQADQVLAGRVGVADFPGGAVVGGDAVQVCHDDRASVDAIFVVGEDLGHVVGGLRWVVAVRKERGEVGGHHRLFDAFYPPTFALIEERPRYVDER